jgi:hypothetical protein
MLSIRSSDKPSGAPSPKPSTAPSVANSAAPSGRPTKPPSPPTSPLRQVRLHELPETTYEVEQQHVLYGQVVLTVIVQAGVPGLDVLLFANIVILPP